MAFFFFGKSRKKVPFFRLRRGGRGPTGAGRASAGVVSKDGVRTHMLDFESAVNGS